MMHHNPYEILHQATPADTIGDSAVTSIPRSHVNFLHLLLGELIREADTSYHSLQEQPNLADVERRLALVRRNAEAMRTLLPARAD